jgi:hypothetical protein
MHGPGWRRVALGVVVVTSSLTGCGDDAPSTGSAAPATSTTLDPYGDDPSFDQGTRREVCRDGAVVERAGRVELAAFIAERWPRVEVLGYECREINDPSNPACRGRVAPRRSSCWSTHASGRAVDVVVGGGPDHPTPAGVALGDEIVTAFLRAEGDTPHVLARTTGVQEIIWNDRCWHPDDADVVRAEDLPSCPIAGHDNHVHLTLSNAGADGETSWYRGR